ncbi:spore germination protein [Paenibacillus cremeus]|nr:spore germination protein [Paenibacillus cremeus]
MKEMENTTEDQPETNSEQDLQKSLSDNLRENEQTLRGVFHQCSDVVFRLISVENQPEVLMVYVDGLVDTKAMEQFILRPLMLRNPSFVEGPHSHLGKVLEEHLVFIAQTKVVTNFQDLVNEVFKAHVAILTEGEGRALLADAGGFDKRSIEESKVENVIQGPRDSFTETLRTNTMLLRRRIPSARLKLESFTIGELTRTDTALAYVEGIADPDLLEEVRQRLHHVRLEGIMDSSYIEEYIQDNPRSPFPQVQKTDRPDTTAASLLEGKIAVLVDCSPSVLILPTTFLVGMQSADDYYERFDFVAARKMVRYCMMVISLIFPSLYVSLTTYNPDLLPGSLYVSIGTAREKSPFPTVIEIVLMDFVFEGLQEAGIRMPSQLGPVVSIVGALVVGEAAVRANIISAPIVIVIAFTGIASYGIPRYGFSIPFRLLRFALVILAGIYGLYGLSLGIIAILIHLVTLESFGIRYLTPIAPLNVKHLKDVLFRTTRWSRRKS